MTDCRAALRRLAMTKLSFRAAVSRVGIRSLRSPNPPRSVGDFFIAISLKYCYTVKGLLTVFRIVASVLVLVGAMLSAGIVWDTADMLQGLMVIINIPVILILAKPAFAALEDYVAQRKAGKEPKYNAKACGIKQETEFWNE